MIFAYSKMLGMHYDESQLEDFDNAGRFLAASAIAAQFEDLTLNNSRFPFMCGNAIYNELRDRADTYEWDYGLLMWRIPQMANFCVEWINSLADDDPIGDCTTDSKKRVEDWCANFKFPFQP